MLSDLPLEPILHNIKRNDKTHAYHLNVTFFLTQNDINDQIKTTMKRRERELELTEGSRKFPVYL